MSPKQRVAAECARRGRAAVIAGCADLLDGRDVDDELVVALGGPPAEYVLSGREGGRTGYWPRVWAARGLLHEWDDSALPALARALEDPAWRVREMAAKVVIHHRVGGLVDAVSPLREDPIARVRAASERAVRTLTDAGY